MAGRPRYPRAMTDDKSEAEPAEPAEPAEQAKRDAQVALTLARTVVRRENEARDRTAADIVEAYAMELLDYLDGSVPRALSAARVACISAAADVAHPARWRASMRAVELCRRAAGLINPDDDEPADPGEPAAGLPGAGLPGAGRRGARKHS
jgi:hypothetical protein